MGYVRMLLVLAVAAFGIANLSGCETAEGFGEDVENTGEAIDESMED